jgi:hypothetical protein
MEQHLLKDTIVPQLQLLLGQNEKNKIDIGIMYTVMVLL